ncbi:MAG: hypothetical protein RIS76_1086 [Verrucomicrobiota bacterium]
MTLAPSPQGLAADIHVPVGAPTIQAGINAAKRGDVVIVADGTYTGPGNRDLDFQRKAITVRSASGDPTLCIIDCERAGRGFHFHSGETVRSVVQGFTIRHGISPFSHSSDPHGGGIFIEASSPTVTHCRFIENANGGVVSLFNSYPTVSHCSFIKNFTDAYGGGMESNFGSHPVVDNCVFVNNSAGYSGGGISGHFSSLINCSFSGNRATAGGAIHSNGGLTKVVNCILWGNSATEKAPELYSETSGTARVSYSDVQGGYPGDGNIDADPVFVNAMAGDLRLNSPTCVDLGDNSAIPATGTTDLEGNARIVGLIVDMGAYEGAQDAIVTIALGTSQLWTGDAAGSDRVALTISSPVLPWTATANDSWLHLDAGNQSGTGSATVVFTFDANEGLSRAGTLTLAGQTLTVTQHGSAQPGVAVANAGFEAPALPVDDAIRYRPSIADQGGSGWQFEYHFDAVNYAGVTARGSGFFDGVDAAIPEGNQVAMLQQWNGVRHVLARFSQQIAGFTNGVYQVSFYAAARQNRVNPFTVDIDDTVLTFRGSLSVTPPELASGAQFQSFVSDPIVLASGSHTLRFISARPQDGDTTSFIDAVTVIQAHVVVAAEPVLTGPVRLENGDLQFGFTGTPEASYSVRSSTDVALPFSAWTEAGPVTVTAPGQFQFTVKPSPGSSMGFYRVVSP